MKKRGHVIRYAYRIECVEIQNQRALPSEFMLAYAGTIRNRRNSTPRPYGESNTQLCVLSWPPHRHQHDEEAEYAEEPGADECYPSAL
jgi:hypothetical protein